MPRVKATLKKMQCTVRSYSNAISSVIGNTGQVCSSCIRKFLNLTRVVNRENEEKYLDVPSISCYEPMNMIFTKVKLKIVCFKSLGVVDL